VRAHSLTLAARPRVYTASTDAPSSSLYYYYYVLYIIRHRLTLCDGNSRRRRRFAFPQAVIIIVRSRSYPIRNEQKKKLKKRPPNWSEDDVKNDFFFLSYVYNIICNLLKNACVPNSWLGRWVFVLISPIFFFHHKGFLYHSPTPYHIICRPWMVNMYRVLHKSNRVSSLRVCPLSKQMDIFINSDRSTAYYIPT